MELNTVVLKMTLPTGSGIDQPWAVEDKGNHFICRNTYFCKTSRGKADGEALFSVKVPKDDPARFRLCFLGRTAANKNGQYYLREYLEDALKRSLCPLNKMVPVKGA